MATEKSLLKSFFKTKNELGMSDSAVEFVKYFLLPFLKGWDPYASVDDAIGAWFNVENRIIVHAKAKRGFRIPGLLALAGGRLSTRCPNRKIVKDQKLLMIIDSKDKSAKVDAIIDGVSRTFILTRPEMEFLRDQVEWRAE